MSDEVESRYAAPSLHRTTCDRYESDQQERLDNLASHEHIYAHSILTSNARSHITHAPVKCVTIS